MTDPSPASALRPIVEGHWETRAGLDPVDIHASISALTFFNVSNQHTFGLIFKMQGKRAEAAALRRASITEMVLRFVRR